MILILSNTHTFTHTHTCEMCSSSHWSHCHVDCTPSMVRKAVFVATGTSRFHKLHSVCVWLWAWA